MVKKMEEQYSNYPAYEFYGGKTSYKKFVEKIEQAARAFLAMGIKKGDRVTICLPNIPQAMDCFYALNRIGAVANMVHPLSARDEITFYLTVSKSKAILTVDMFYEKVEEALKKVPQKVTVLVARIQDELNPILKAAYVLKAGRPYLKYPNTDHSMLWSRFLKNGKKNIPLPDIEWGNRYS